MKNSASLIKAIINTYAILFFSQSRVLGVILLLVSMFNLAAGLSGLACVMLSLFVATVMGYDKESIKMGVYSFNSLLLGIAFGSFYHINLQYFLWLAIACLIVVVITIVLVERLGKIGLPILSLPFIITFWIVLLAANSVFNTGLYQQSSSLLGEIYNGSGKMAGFHEYLKINLPVYIALFFRSLSAILFQNNILAGILMSVGLLIHSRIAFSLLVIGFAAACGFNSITHVYPEGISYYHLGANFMMTSAAIGSFFLIPSWRSYLWAIICIPVTFILINALTNIMGVHYLPIFSLPFCIVNFTLLYFFLLRKDPGKLHLVFVQHYSPERNLYQFLNQQSRLADLRYFNFHLPFMGSWTVSQGYNGSITHKNDWSQALDFVITDDDKQTFKYPGTLPEHFYCYSKPVLACGDGVVEAVVDHIEDNEIGQVNTKENWGNTVVIRHLTGLYSKVSHLKKNSIKVKPGDFVKHGDLLGLCGNSGRSPEPHLHFQVQATPYIGSKTMAYPFAYYQTDSNGQVLFHSFSIPQEGEILHAATANTSLKKAFDFQPGYVAGLTKSKGPKEVIEVYTDAYNQSYMYSRSTGATAYFINNGNVFYFTSFYGDRKSMLYYFYLAAYKVIFSDDETVVAADVYPVQLTGDKVMLWLQDLVAPFYRFIIINYQSGYVDQKAGAGIRAKQFKQIAGAGKQVMEANISIANNSIQAFEVNINGTNIEAKWVTENI